MKKIEIERTIQAKPEQVYAALTDAGRLQSWFCDWARTDPRAGGRFTFFWNTGYEAQGTFVHLKAPEGLGLIWQGLGEPAQTLVKIELEEKDGATEMELKHLGFGSGPTWKRVYAEAEKSWTKALKNLQSVLEQGVDLREALRPFLGVLIDNLDPERAKKEGIATETGVYVNEPVEGGAAEAAGIQSGDVIVALGKGEVTDFVTLTTALQAHQAGDTVDVELVRGQDKLTVQATLKKREQPDFPEDPAAAAAQVRERQAEYNKALVEATTGLNEELAGQSPEEEEWSVKRVLAHLAGTERGLHQYIFRICFGQRVEGAFDPAYAPDQNEVILAMEPTLEGLLARFARDQEETALLLENLSEATLADAFRYRQVLQAIHQFHTLHTADHIEQIRRAAKAVTGQAAES
jgi:uncharacterized protein YndB with AHSA1/START domain